MIHDVNNYVCLVQGGGAGDDGEGGVVGGDMLHSYQHFFTGTPCTPCTPWLSTVRSRTRCQPLYQSLWHCNLNSWE